MPGGIQLCSREYRMTLLNIGGNMNVCNDESFLPTHPLPLFVPSPM